VLLDDRDICVLDPTRDYQVRGISTAARVLGERWRE
jgi:hypothetical protein